MHPYSQKHHISDSTQFPHSDVILFPTRLSGPSSRGGWGNVTFVGGKGPLLTSKVTVFWPQKWRFERQNVVFLTSKVTVFLTQKWLFWPKKWLFLTQKWLFSTSKIHYFKGKSGDFHPQKGSLPPPHGRWSPPPPHTPCTASKGVVEDGVHAELIILAVKSGKAAKSGPPYL